MKKERITILDNEEYLRQVSAEVDFSDKSYLEDIKELKEFCQNDNIFALAAVQIGIPKRIIYLRSTTTDLDKLTDKSYDEGRVLINPVILRRVGQTSYLESCASCPDKSATGILDNPEDKYLSCFVVRPYLMEVEYYDIEGNKQVGTFEGFESTVLSHEYDHLNGVLHYDLVPEEEILALNFEERKQYREAHPYEIISKTREYR